jgi:hypothetical protein
MVILAVQSKEGLRKKVDGLEGVGIVLLFAAAV